MVRQVRRVLCDRRHTSCVGWPTQPEKIIAMLDPDELLVRAVASALDECGLAPSADDDDAKALLRALWERGYEVSRTAPMVPDESA
jgi:hypothetical protein